MSAKIIANVGPFGELGYQGGLICKNPLDLQLFKFLTCSTDSVLIAGRSTAYSMRKVSPNGREFYYLSNTQKNRIGNWKHIDYSKIEQFDKQVYVIGGAKVYHSLIDIVDEAILMTDESIAYYPCDTYWAYEDYFVRKELLFRHESLTCYRWRKKECTY